MNWSFFSRAAFPLVVLLYCASYSFQTYDLPIKSILFPLFLIVLLVVLTLIEIISVTKRSEVTFSDLGTKFDGASIIKFFHTYAGQLAIVGSTLAYPLALETLGFVISTFLYLCVLFVFLRSTRPLASVIFAAAIALGLGWLLLDLLAMRFPRASFIALPWFF